MTGDLIPVEVRQFILRRIDSIAQLEALLLLAGNPAETWTVAGVAQRLYISETESAALLAQLQSEGMLAAQPGDPPAYRYQPHTAELEEVLKKVIESYVRHLVPVTNLVHTKPTTRIQEFADAFKFRKDDP